MLVEACQRPRRHVHFGIGGHVRHQYDPAEAFLALRQIAERLGEEHKSHGKLDLGELAGPRGRQTIYGMSIWRDEDQDNLDQALAEARAARRKK